MSSPPKEKLETKGGHLPAVKAGGMRIVQKHQPTPPPEEPKKENPEEEDDYQDSGLPEKEPSLVVSGAVTKGDKDFTPAAAQVAHQKPQPSISKLPPSQNFTQIHQPRK